jgi:hypothetical protein
MRNFTPTVKEREAGQPCLSSVRNAQEGMMMSPLLSLSRAESDSPACALWQLAGVAV